MSDLFGVLNIDKPINITSADVVGKLKKILRVKKIGHGGTLDPMATGVLPILVGGATRLMEHVTRGKKIYDAEATLGVRTDTLDAHGTVISRSEIPEGITKNRIRDVAARWQGVVTQKTPSFSAVKINGRRLYSLARAGCPPEELPTREVTIHSLDVLEWSPPVLSFRVECGKGTYIRQLADDIGAELGCGAHLSSLRRIRVGCLTIETAIGFETLANKRHEGCINDLVIHPRTILSHLPCANIAKNDILTLCHGQSLSVSSLISESGGSLQLKENSNIAVYSEENTLVAIAELKENRIFPRKVFYKEPNFD